MWVINPLLMGWGDPGSGVSNLPRSWRTRNEPRPRRVPKSPYKGVRSPVHNSLTRWFTNRRTPQDSFFCTLLDTLVTSPYVTVDDLLIKYWW